MSAVEQDVLRTPSPDKAEIIKALKVLFDPADVIELRAFHKNPKRTDAGYFDAKHRDQLTKEARRLSAAGAAVYVNLNPIDPQLLARYANRVEHHAKATATDADVMRRRWLLLDFDPVRPKDTSATSAQLDAAKACARQCYQALRNDGWPHPLAAESGNGMHLLYPIDLPNDAASRDLIKGALSGLVLRFQPSDVAIDQSVFNAARVIKLYGTVANKGDHTTLAPWRQSRLICMSAHRDIVTVEQLRAVQPPSESHNASQAPSPQSFDLDSFLIRLGIGYSQDTHEGRDRYKLDHCPFNAEHGRGEAAIFEGRDGKLGFKCQHNSCADKHWQDVRALVDGLPETRTRPTINEKVSAQDGVHQAGNGQQAGAGEAKATDVGLCFTPLADMLDEPDEEQPWLVDGLLPEAGLSMLTARPKAGKSTLARTLALAIARGDPFLDRQAVKGTVLYLALEDKRGELKRQFRAMGAANEQIHIYCATAPADGVEKLTNAVMQVRPALVIIDPIIRLSRMVDSNDYAQVSRALEPFIALARQSGAHVCLVHHSGRGDRNGVDAPMGSTAFAASVDTILVMKRTDRMRTLSSEQRYGDNLEELVLSMDDAGRINAAGSKSDHDTADAADSITEYLKANPDADHKGLRENIGHQWKTVWTALTKLVNDHKVERKGFGKRGSPYLYYLPQVDQYQEPEVEKSVACSLVPGIDHEQAKQETSNNLSVCETDGYSCSRDSAQSAPIDKFREQENKALATSNRGHFDAEREGNNTCQACLGEGCRWCRPSGGGGALEFDQVVI